MNYKRIEYIINRQLKREMQTKKLINKLDKYLENRYKIQKKYEEINNDNNIRLIKLNNPHKNIYICSTINNEINTPFPGSCCCFNCSS